MRVILVEINGDAFDNIWNQPLIYSITVSPVLWMSTIYYYYRPKRRQIIYNCDHNTPPKKE